MTVSPEATAARLLGNDRTETTDLIVRLCLDVLGEEWLDDLVRALNVQWPHRHPSISHVRVLVSSDDVNLLRARSASSRSKISVSVESSVPAGYADIHLIFTQ